MHSNYNVLSYYNILQYADVLPISSFLLIYLSRFDYNIKIHLCFTKIIFFCLTQNNFINVSSTSTYINIDNFG